MLLRLWVRRPRTMVDRAQWRGAAGMAMLPTDSVLQHARAALPCRVRMHRAGLSAACRLGPGNAASRDSPARRHASGGLDVCRPSAAAAITDWRAEGEAGHGESVVIHDAGAATQDRYLAKTEKSGSFSVGMSLPTVGHLLRPRPPAAPSPAGGPSRTGRS